MRKLTCFISHFLTGNLGTTLNAGSNNPSSGWGAGGSKPTSPMNGSPQHRSSNWNPQQGATSPMPGVTPTGTPVHQMKSPMDGPSRPDYSRSHFDTAFKPADPCKYFRKMRETMLMFSLTHYVFCMRKKVKTSSCAIEKFVICM